MRGWRRGPQWAEGLPPGTLQLFVLFFFFFGFLFQVLLLIQKLESIPGQKGDLAAGVTHV